MIVEGQSKVESMVVSLPQKTVKRKRRKLECNVNDIRFCHTHMEKDVIDA